MLKRLFIILVFIIPLNVSAKNNINIVCNNSGLHNNEIVDCKVEIDETNYIITSVSAEITVDKNLEIIDSSYDDKNWLMLDSKFNIKDINLISETRDKKDNSVIATFKVKAINKKKSIGKISLKYINLGDSDYKEHKEEDEVISLNLKYDDKTNNNKTLFIGIGFIILLIVLIMVYIFIKRSKRR